MNPELQRNLWLEASRRQLVAAGVILALIFGAAWLVDRGGAGGFITASIGIFVIAGLIWGPRQARASVVHEVYARTWEFQRLSALTAWEMTWGKLFGSTSRAWFTAGLALLVGFLELASISTVPGALFWVLIAIGLAVLMQATALASGLTDIRKARAAGRPPGMRSPSLVLIAAVIIAAGALVWLRRHVSLNDHFSWSSQPGAPGFDVHFGGPIAWWGRSYDSLGFAAWSLAFFAVWAVVWAWRMMRLELQMQNGPWIWVLFVILFGLYAAGFDPNADLPADRGAIRLADAGLAFALCAYASAFAEPADRVRVRLFARAFRRLELGKVLSLAPPVIAPAKLAGLAALAVAVIRWREADDASALFALALFVFLLRDLGAIAFTRFAARGGSDFSAVLLLFLLYVVGGIIGRAFGGPNGAALFWPNGAYPGTSLLGAAVAAAVLWVFAVRRIRQRTPSPAPRPLTLVDPEPPQAP